MGKKCVKIVITIRNDPLSEWMMLLVLEHRQ